MATYTLISSNVLSSSAASVTFSLIPATYTDLVLRVSIRTDAAVSNDTLLVKFNNDSSTLYSTTLLRGSGTATSSSTLGTQPSINARQINANTSVSNTFSSTEIYIPSYTVSQSKPSSIFFAQETDVTGAFIGSIATLYRSNTAISQIDLNPQTGPNFLSTSSFYLYGISNA